MWDKDNNKIECDLRCLNVCFLKDIISISWFFFFSFKVMKKESRYTFHIRKNFTISLPSNGNLIRKFPFYRTKSRVSKDSNRSNSRGNMNKVLRMRRGWYRFRERIAYAPRHTHLFSLFISFFVFYTNAFAWRKRHVRPLRIHGLFKWGQDEKQAHSSSPPPAAQSPWIVICCRGQTS